MSIMKVCTSCGEEKPYSRFNKKKGGVEGVRTQCKVCQREHNKVWYQNNREKKLEKSREWSENNKEYHRTLKLKWNEENSEYIKKRGRTTYQKNRKSILNKCHKYIEENRHKRHAQQILQYAVRSGKVVLPDVCEVCGKGEKLDGHHGDYDKPLDVDWVCRSCHLRIHRSKS